MDGNLGRGGWNYKGREGFERNQGGRVRGGMGRSMVLRMGMEDFDWFCLRYIYIKFASRKVACCWRKGIDLYIFGS